MIISQWTSRELYSKPAVRTLLSFEDTLFFSRSKPKDDSDQYCTIHSYLCCINMNFDQFNFEDMGSSFLSGSKRDRDETGAFEGDIFENTAKKISVDYDDANFQSLMTAPIAMTVPITRDAIEEQPQMLSGRKTIAEPKPEPFPYYFYRDHSTEPDPDPLTPLTPPGRVPNFPAKMHSILYREELKDIIAWMPHGRAWRVLKPREFETIVIPTYFEHAKFSSFIRQANGWGFRRITQGRDRNAYYHPLFLRALPHLCKTMKRPGVAEKQASDPDYEPDLYKISEIHPIPQRTNDDSILLECTLKGGPKARMPIYTSVGLSQAPPSQMLPRDPPKLTPNDQLSLHAFRQSLGASESQLKNQGQAPSDSAPSRIQAPRDISPAMMPQTNMMPTPMNPLPTNMPGMDSGISPLALANQLAFAAPNMPGNVPKRSVPESNSASQSNANLSNGSGSDADNNTSQQNMAAAQFAAGFAAATALSHQQFQAMMAQLGAGMFMQQGNNSNQTNTSNNNVNNPIGQASGMAFAANNADSSAAMASVQRSMSQMQQAMQQTFRQAQQNFQQSQNQMNAQAQASINTQGNPQQQIHNAESSMKQMQENFQRAQQELFMPQQQQDQQQMNQMHENSLPNNILQQNPNSSQQRQSTNFDHELPIQQRANSGRNGNMNGSQTYQQQLSFQGDGSEGNNYLAL